MRTRTTTFDRSASRSADKAAADWEADEAWRFAQELLGQPTSRAPRPGVDATARDELREWVASITTPSWPRSARETPDEELLEWVAAITTPSWGSPARENLSPEYLEWIAAITGVDEGQWDPAKHPRGGYPQNRGWWSPGGGGGNSGGAASDGRGGERKLLRNDGRWPAGPRALLTAMQTPAAPAQRAPGTMAPALPRVGSGGAATANAGAAAGVAGAGLLKGMGNASMAQYWGHKHAMQGMTDIWSYELLKRVRAGTLSLEDATGIVNMARQSAYEQGFKPTGGTHAEVHKSTTDFLEKAEAVYWSRKKQRAESAAKSAEKAKADAPAGAAADAPPKQSLPPEERPKPATAAPLEHTPETHPADFRPVKGTNAKENIKTGEIWVKDMKHRNHYEVYKNKKMYDNKARNRSVWDDGRFKEHL